MILDIDSESSLDPARVGAKTAWLAMGRRSGLPLLPGFAVDATASRHHLTLGAQTLETRGSGGARLVVANEPLNFAEELVEAGSHLGTDLVARSSTALEASGFWSGAFTSYIDVSPEMLPKAVAGCWASAFSVQSLERQELASVEPGSFLMGVLVQPSLSPEAGGTADLDEYGSVLVHGVKGSPAPLLQGFISGETARWDGEWRGEALVELIGKEALDTIAVSLHKAHADLGVNHFEWALDGQVWILQIGVNQPRLVPAVPSTPPDGFSDPALVELVRMIMATPGPLGREFVHPWALAGPPTHRSRIPILPQGGMTEIRLLADELTSEVWGLPAAEGRSAAAEALSLVRSDDPVAGLKRISALNQPDFHRASRLLALLAGLRKEMVDRGVARNEGSGWYLTVAEVAAVLDGENVQMGPRMGLGPWEPLVAQLVLAAGDKKWGTPAAAGLGAGPLAAVSGVADTDRFVPRQVLATSLPVPALAPLLWDAAAVVTRAGSPAAHFFDSARSLGVPAASGVELAHDADVIVAVDGFTGTVATLDLEPEHE